MKRGLELGMGILLLAGVFFLGREEAAVVGGVAGEAPLVMIDAGHGERIREKWESEGHWRRI